jgi:anti-sigma factor RsiW
MKDCREIEPLMAPYVDGDTTPEDRAAVLQHVNACGCCRDELGVQRAARDLVHARRGELRDKASSGLHARCVAHAASLNQALPNSHVLASTRRTHLLTRRLPLAAAATILLAIAAVFGFGLNNKVQALAFQMTLDHLKCTRLHGAPSDDPVAVAQQWGAKFGWPLRVPPSADPPGVKLRVVRRCGVTDGRVAHVIYQWRGEPLSLYVLPTNAIEGTRELERFGHESVMWAQNGRTYVLLAATTRRRELDGVVRYMRANAY